MDDEHSELHGRTRRWVACPSPPLTFANKPHQQGVFNYILVRGSSENAGILYYRDSMEEGFNFSD